VPLPLPPYALSSPAFPFRHLAALAGRAPIGGTREVALACFVTARLVAEHLTERLDVPSATRAARSVATKGWLGTLALPAVVRGPLTRCVETSVEGPRAAVATEVAALAAASAEFLDSFSRGELEALVVALGG
jgi:hypothetical protein